MENLRNGNIFGWSIIGPQSRGLAHHVGILSDINYENILESEIIHYGIDSIAQIRIETLGEAIEGRDVTLIGINTNWQLIIPDMVDLEEYLESHPIYDILYCNCQHFVQYWLPELVIESDAALQLLPSVGNLLALSLRGKWKLLDSTVRDMIELYQQTPNICDWTYTIQVCNEKEL